jgi:hypothetical protein
MLEIITSDALPGLRHGFFTRKGGASSGIFAGLNCGTGSSDLSDAQKRELRIKGGVMVDVAEGAAARAGRPRWPGALAAPGMYGPDWVSG